jgi:hypothetical protein
MAKPTLYPDWSVKVDGTDNDVIDGTTGENNVVDPSAGKKLTGFLYDEKPPRQNFNWLFRIITQWIRWFDASVIDLYSKLTASAIANDSTVAGTNVDDALDTLGGLISGLGSDDIHNDSTITGTTVSNALVTLSSDTGITNTSDMEGSAVHDALDKLDAQRKWFICGCGYGRNAANQIGYNDGYAMDATNTYLMRMPRQGGGTFFKKVINSIGFVAGYDVNGLAAGITIVANTKLAIFLLRLPSGAFDIGYDTSLTAANLRSDTACLATHYRRIGTCMVHSMSGANAILYRCLQLSGGKHIVYAYETSSAFPFYEKAVADWGATYEADIYTPMPGIPCELYYQVAPPAGTGGEATCYVIPQEISADAAHIALWNMWHASSLATGPFGSGLLKGYMTTGALYAAALPYTNILVRFQILGWMDFLDQSFPGS